MEIWKYGNLHLSELRSLFPSLILFFPSFFPLHFFLPGTMKVKSSSIQVGDLIIVEKVGVLISPVFVKL